MGRQFSIFSSHFDLTCRANGYQNHVPSHFLSSIPGTDSRFLVEGGPHPKSWNAMMGMGSWLLIFTPKHPWRFFCWKWSDFVTEKKWRIVARRPSRELVIFSFWKMNVKRQIQCPRMKPSCGFSTQNIYVASEYIAQTLKNLKMVHELGRSLHVPATSSSCRVRQSNLHIYMHEQSSTSGHQYASPPQPWTIFKLWWSQSLTPKDMCKRMKTTRIRAPLHSVTASPPCVPVFASCGVGLDYQRVRTPSSELFPQ